MSDIMHVKVVAGEKTVDPYGTPALEAPCGCQPVECGCVIPRDLCPHHDTKVTNRKLYGHMARNCPGPILHKKESRSANAWQLTLF